MASKAEELLLARVSLTNQRAAEHFGIGIGGLIAFFAICHWTRKLSIKHVPPSSGLILVGASITRPFRQLAKGKIVYGILLLPGRMGLALVYLAINLAVTFTNIIDWSEQTLFAQRLGWYVCESKVLRPSSRCSPTYRA